MISNHPAVYSQSLQSSSFVISNTYPIVLDPTLYRAEDPCVWSVFHTTTLSSRCLPCYQCRAHSWKSWLLVPRLGEIGSWTMATWCLLIRYAFISLLYHKPWYISWRSWVIFPQKGTRGCGRPTTPTGLRLRLLGEAWTCSKLYI